MEDIESLKQSIAALKKLVDSAAGVLADGKIGFSDLDELPGIISGAKDMIVALKGVGAEVKDLDVAEVKELLTAVLELGVYAASKFGFKS